MKVGKQSKRKQSPIDDAVLSPVAEPSVNSQYRALLPPPVPKPMVSDSGAKNTPAARNTILSWLAAGWSKGRACDEAGVSTKSLQRWRAEDDEFNAAVTDATERGIDVLEDAARFRAVEGVARPIFQQGVCVGHVVEHSDALMQMMLAGKRSAYSRTKHEHSGTDGEPIKTLVEVSFVAPKGQK